MNEKLPTDLVIDIETLSVNTNEAPVVLTIGAVTFNKNGLCSEFKEIVNLEDSLKRGDHIDSETLYWWLNQPEEARLSLGILPEDSVKRYPLYIVITMLELFIQREFEHIPKEYRVWANSPMFDLAVIRKHKGSDTVWGFRQERDYRTLRDMVGVEPENALPSHDCLNDCKNQAQHIIKYYLNKETNNV
jgi:hypothetical protein